MILAIAVIYETMLGYVRRLIIVIVGVRIDAKLTLHVFARLVRLPLDYFERHPAGETMYNINADQPSPRIHHRQAADHLPRPDHPVRAAAVPVLAERNSRLDRRWPAPASSSLIILAYLRPMRVVFGRVIHGGNLQAAPP